MDTIKSYWNITALCGKYFKSVIALKIKFKWKIIKWKEVCYNITVSIEGNLLKKVLCFLTTIEKVYQRESIPFYLF